MTEATYRRARSLFRPATIGARVRLRTKWRRGEVGRIVERHDDRIDGWASLGVELSSSPPGLISYVRRFEVSVTGEP